MNNPSPLIPQGSMMEQKNQSRSRLKIAFFCVVGVHVAVVLVALLAQGCKREQPVPPPPVDAQIPADTNLPPTDTSAPYTSSTSVPPTSVEPPVAVPPMTSGVAEYTVERGDTFYSIAKKHGVSMKAVQDANPGVEPTKLKPGQKIVIPPPTVAPANGTAPTVTADGEQSYVVKSGDTLSAIATRFGTTVKAIRAANGLVTDKIKVGQKLIIPAKVEAPSTVPAPAPTTVPPAQ